MAFELERILYDTEDFLRRSLGSSAAREAKKRKARRAWQEAVGRTRRAGLLFVGIVGVLIALSLVASVPLLTWIIALPTIFLFALVSLFWPTRDARRQDDPRRPIELGALAARAEEWLLDRRRELPGRALPAADRILTRLAELQPDLVALDPGSPVGGDARRLIGEHLPRLVDSYLELPASARAPGSESSKRFGESLDIVSGELDHLLERASTDRHLSFQTQSRFIEARYREDDGLKGD